MANATKYVDNANGNNGNTGDSEAQAYADIPTAVSAITGGGNTIYVQAGTTYTRTSTHAVLTSTQAGDVTDGPNRIIGYTTTPGASDGRPIITSATNSVNLISMNAAGWWEFHHLNLTHTAATRGAALARVTASSSGAKFFDCVTDGCSRFVDGSGGSLGTISIEGTEAKNCTDVLIRNEGGAGIYTYGCDFHDNASHVIYNGSGVGQPVVCASTIFDTNASCYLNDAANRAFLPIFVSCIFVDNTASAIRDDGIAGSAGSLTLYLQNCIFYGNASYAIESADTALLNGLRLRCFRNNAYGSNNGGGTGLNFLNVTAGPFDITLSADPFTNRASRDFSLNNTAGGGALLRGLGFPLTFPGGTTLSYPDIGAAQRQVTASGTTIAGTPMLRGMV